MKKLPSELDNYELFNGLGVGVLLIDKQGTILFSNHHFESMTMFPCSKLEGTQFSALVAQGYKTNFKELLKLRPRDEESLLSETLIPLRRKSGKMLHTSIFIKDSRNRDYKIMTVLNIEPRKELEKDLERAYSQMMETNRFLSLAEMAAGIGHEINNPLAIIYGYSERLQNLARENTLNKEEVVSITGKILEGSQRVSKIVQALRKLSQKQEYEDIKNIPINEVIQSALELYEERIHTKGIQLNYEPCDPTWNIRCSKFQVVQVLLNLLENSIQAIEKTENPSIQFQVSQKDKNVSIDVIDNGPGVPKDVLAKIFDPFFTTKEVGKGTGLGLSLSKSIIKKQRGNLSYEDSFSGACFRLSFPLVELNETQNAQEKMKMHIAENSSSRKNEISDFDESQYTILFVDDEPDLIEITGMGLSEVGYKVFTATNVKDGMKIFEKEDIDLIISDINMPHLSGIDFSHLLKHSKKPFPKLFFLTGSSDLMLSTYYALGVESFISKPVSLLTLLNEIKQCLLPREKALNLLSHKHARSTERFTFDISDSNSDNQVLSVGRGGFFVKTSELPAVGDKIQFELSFTHQGMKRRVSGVAEVCWLRSKPSPEGPSGFGAKFQSFEKEGVNDFFDYLDFLSLVAFIPAA